jgi:ABC-type multidrug transport system fused ATPase/permease subunit
MPGLSTAVTDERSAPRFRKHALPEVQTDLTKLEKNYIAVQNTCQHVIPQQRPIDIWTTAPLKIVSVEMHNILYSPWAVALIFAQLVFNTVEAVSHACLMKSASIVVTDPSHASILFAGYVAGWLIGQPTFIAFDNFRIRWEDAAYRNFIQAIENANGGRVDVWADEVHRGRLAAMAGAQGRATLSRVISTTSRVTGLLLGAIFSGVTLSVAISGWFGLMLGLGSVSVALYLYNTRSRYAALAEREQQSEAELERLIVRLPDNLMLPNEMNRLEFKTKLKAKLNAFSYAVSSSNMYANFQNSLLSIILGIPVLSILLFESFTDGEHATKVIASAPKSLRLLNDVQDLLLSASHVASTHMAGDTLVEIIQTANLKVWKAKISKLRACFHQVKIFHGKSKQVYSVENLNDNLTLLTKPGRWTVTGENGTGKSTLLQALALLFESTAFYLPASHMLEFQATGLSEGQKKRAQFLEIDRSSTSSLLLLDEWNAPLDVETERELDEIINTWAETRTVIEVLHRPVRYAGE